MSKILVIKSSVSGSGSVSNRLVDGLVRRIAAEHSGSTIVERDLDREAVPHLGSVTLAGIGRGGSEGAASQQARILSDALIAELRDADIVVIGAPMYNFGIASTLKSWFDHVLRAGVTFEYGAGGPRGLIPSKPVIVVETRGGVYSEGPAAALDAQEPHLRTMLGFMGLDDVRFVRAEGLAMGEAERSIAQASLELDRVATPGFSLAA